MVWWFKKKIKEYLERDGKSYEGRAEAFCRPKELENALLQIKEDFDIEVWGELIGTDGERVEYMEVPLPENFKIPYLSYSSFKLREAAYERYGNIRYWGPLTFFPGIPGIEITAEGKDRDEAELKLEKIRSYF